MTNYNFPFTRWYTWYLSSTPAQPHHFGSSLPPPRLDKDRLLDSRPVLKAVWRKQNRWSRGESVLDVYDMFLDLLWRWLEKTSSTVITMQKSWSVTFSKWQCWDAPSLLEWLESQSQAGCPLFNHVIILVITDHQFSLWASAQNTPTYSAIIRPTIEIENQRTDWVIDSTIIKCIWVLWLKWLQKIRLVRQMVMFVI